MDCPSEENLIRTKLQPIEGIKNLEFDLEGRKLSVFHEGKVEPIEHSIKELKLGGKLVSSEHTDQTHFEDQVQQRQLLWTVLIINFVFFGIEMTTGLISRSMGLVADSLDMLADSFVYGISLLAVGSTVVFKKRIATLAGYFQITLAILGFIEVIRRVTSSGEVPNFQTMIIVSVFALAANAICLWLLQRSRSKDEAHIRASMIFTSNDVIINLGVITAGILVLVLDSKIPDLIIGSIVFVLVIQGAIRILKLGK